MITVISSFFALFCNSHISITLNISALHILLTHPKLLHFDFYTMQYWPKRITATNDVDLLFPMTTCPAYRFPNPSNAEATFVQSTSTQRYFENHLNPVMLVFIR